jgi:ABC-type glycerol-3-phosphate transport system substrate-binding protein
MIWADTVGSHSYGIPWLLDVGHHFYRMDILDAEGLKPATTWQGLQTAFWTAMSTAAEQELTNALIGKESPQQALKNAQGKIEAILAGA